MKQLRLVFGLALIPMCALLGSFIPLWGGSLLFIGCVLGIVLSYLFLTYGPGSKKNQLPTSYYLHHDQLLNGGVNQRAIEDTASGAQQENRSPLIYIPHPSPPIGRF